MTAINTQVEPLFNCKLDVTVHVPSVIEVKLGCYVVFVSLDVLEMFFTMSLTILHMFFTVI